MLNVIAIFALVYSGLNWLLFVALTFLNDIPALERLVRKISETREKVGLAHTELQSVDPNKLLQSAGSLAGAFKKAGASPTAAAMSVFGLVVAGVAAGLGKF
jgi:hypothetical protein